MHRVFNLRRIAFRIAMCAIAGLRVTPIAAAETSRTPFAIATGPTGGTYFPVGEAIAAIISHPPGVYRCQTAGACGPPGLIASVRTSAGAVANVLAVNAGTFDAALAQSDVIVDAVSGRGPFKSSGPQKHVRILADLFPEEVHLIARNAAHVHSVADLKGKRVALGPSNSGSMVTAKTVLAAFHVALSRIKPNTDPTDVAAEALSKQKIDAMFFVGGAPVPLIRSLLAGGKAELVPITGAGRDRVLKTSHAFSATVIPAGLYPGQHATETVGVHALLIVNDVVPDAVAYGVLRALFNPANRATLSGSHRSAESINLNTATLDIPAPLHPGAARFYREKGKLPAKAKSGKP